MDEDTNYSTLLKAFPVLYNELNNVKPSLMVKKQVSKNEAMAS